MNFQEFRAIESARDDLMGFDGSVQESRLKDDEWLISFDRYAEMYAEQFPKFVGVIQCPLEDDDSKFQSLAICKGKVLYQVPAMFGKCKLNILVDVRQKEKERFIQEKKLEGSQVASQISRLSMSKFDYLVDSAFPEDSVDWVDDSGFWLILEGGSSQGIRYNFPPDVR